MSYNLILQEESREAIRLRVQGKSWKEINSNIKLVSGLRKSDIYVGCVVEYIKLVGLKFFEEKLLNRNKPLINYLEELFGIRKEMMGEFVDSIGIKTSYGFKFDIVDRKLNKLDQNRIIGIGDCALRTFVSAFNITYEEAKNLCIDNRFFRYESDPIFKGVSDYTIQKVFKLKGWTFISDIDKILSRKISLNDLFHRSPGLKEEKISILTDQHIFYVEKSIIIDTYADGFSNIEIIFVPNDRKNQVIEKIQSILL